MCGPNIVKTLRKSPKTPTVGAGIPFDPQSIKFYGPKDFGIEDRMGQWLLISQLNLFAFLVLFVQFQTNTKDIAGKTAGADEDDNSTVGPKS